MADQRQRLTSTAAAYLQQAMHRGLPEGGAMIGGSALGRTR